MQPLEGDLYRLDNCVLEGFKKTLDKCPPFMRECVRVFGVEGVSKKIAAIIRKRHGNEASGMFSITFEEFNKAISDAQIECLKEMPADKLFIDFEKKE